MKILVTGSAGFIGYHLTRKLCGRGDRVISLDNLNAYYDIRLKYDRLAELGINDIAEQRYIRSATMPNHRFIKLDLIDGAALNRLFADEGFDAVCHMAAQAGVRYSLENPRAYIDSNIVGFFNVLEACRHYAVNNLCFASSSSVYGLNKKMPFSVSDNVDHPISLYAASKKSNELMAHTYSHLYGINATGLRFFTVYGPWGRPDMAPYLFTKAAIERMPVKVYNHGEMTRDFTYIDDIVNGVVQALDNPAKADPKCSKKHPQAHLANYRIYNLGSGRPVQLMEMIAAIEKATGRLLNKNMEQIQPGDVPNTLADIKETERALGYRPGVSIQSGIDRFLKWYKAYYSQDR